MIASRVLLASSALLLAAATGCGSSSKSTTGGTGGAGGGTATGGGATTTSTTSTTSMTASTGGSGTGGTGTATGPSAPQVVNPSHGKVTATPKVQLIAYASDSFAPDVDKLVTELTTTSTWATQTAEYGVGALTKLPTIMLPGTPPTMLDDSTNTGSPFQNTLVGHITGASPDWAPADPETIYLFLLPLGTDISSGGNCCSGFLGYHWEATAGSTSVPYAVVCNCPAFQGDPLTPLQEVTTSVSHELVEAATDPYVLSDPAFGQTDDADIVWTLATGGEIADMCEYNTDANVIPAGATYMIQRSWSNAAAKAGKNPCVPAPSTPYFNSYPMLADKVSFDGGGGPVSTSGVKISKGGSVTIPVEMISDGATSGPWKVKVYDLNSYLGQGSPNLTLSLDKSSGSNGDTLHLTITANSFDSQTGGAAFVLESTLGGQQNLTMGAVGP